MSLKYHVASLDEVPEQLRADYKPDASGGFVLQVEGVVPEAQVSGLKKKNEELLNEKKKLLGQYNELLENSKLTETQRADLQSKVDALEAQVLTADELAAKKIARAREEYEGKLKAESSKAEHYQRLYQTSTIEAELTKAAQEFSAWSPSQVYGLLAGKTRLEPTLGDDGKPNGQYQVITTVPVVEGDKRIEKDMPAAEAVKAFLGLPENRNLVQGAGGSGGGAHHQGRPTPAGTIHAGDRAGFAANLADIASGKIKVVA